MRDKQLAPFSEMETEAKVIEKNKNIQLISKIKVIIKNIKTKNY